MKFRHLSLLLTVLLAACSLQTNLPYPLNLQPATQVIPSLPAVTVAPISTQDAALSERAPSSLAITGSTENPAPYNETGGEGTAETPATGSTQSPADLQPTPAPDPSVTPTHIPIDTHNAGQLHPVAIYPIFRRGLLRSVRWSPDGQNLVIETSQGIQVLSAPNLQKRFSLPDVRPLAFMQNGDLLLLQNGKTLTRFDLAEGGSEPVPVQLPSKQSSPFALSPDGSSWVTVLENDSLQVKNLDTSQSQEIKLATKTAIPYEVIGLIFSPDGKQLFTHIRRTDGETELIAVDCSTWQQAFEVFQADGNLVFSGDGQQMIYLGGDRLKIDFTRDGKNWATLVRLIENKLTTERTSMLSAEGFSFIARTGQVGVLYNNQVVDLSQKDSQWLPSTLMIYDTQTAKTERYIENLPRQVLSFAISPDGSSFFTTSQDGILRVWETGSGKLIKASEPYDTDESPHISADGKMVAYAVGDHAAVADAATGKLIATFGSYPGSLKLEAQFAGEKTLAVQVETHWQRFIETWDISTGQVLKRYASLGDCTFNRDGNLMLCHDDYVHIYDIPSGQSLLDYEPSRIGFELALSDDGRRFAYCSLGSEFVYVWEIHLGAIPKYMLGGKPGVCGKLVFSEDGEKLASAGGAVWSIADSQELVTFKPVSGSLAAMDKSTSLMLVYPNLIDLSSGKELEAMQAAPGLRAVYFQPDGRTLVLQTRRGVEFWTADAP